jgi:hypothetical protein
VTSRGPVPGDPEQTPGSTEGSGGRIGTLRGAAVDVDRRRLGLAVGGICVAGLVVAVVVLFVAGLQKNAQITRLRQHGIPVEITVTGCLGLMGGSGSNLVGYQCSGTLTVAGHHYDEVIPGSTLRSPGSRLQVVAVPGDPALLATTGALAAEHASWRVFILPATLLLILVLLAGTVALRRGRALRLSPQGVSTTASPAGG